MTEAVKKRLPKYKRAETPPSFRLTDRDTQVLMALSRYRFLTSYQIQRLFFPTPQTTNQRLKRLFHAHYLERIPPVFLGGFPIYTLDKKGLVLLEDLGVPEDKIKKEKKRKILTHQALDHALCLNDFRISLELSLNKRALILETFLGEQELRHAYRVWSDRRQEEIRRVFSPDSFFKIKSGEKTLSCFSELDRGEQPLKRIRKKLNIYREFSAVGKYQEKFKGRKFRILFVIEPRWAEKGLKNRRLQNIKKEAEKLQATNVWLTTLDELREKDMFDHIWQRAGYKAVQPFL